MLWSIWLFASPPLKCLGFSWVLPRHYLCWHLNKLKQIWANSFSAGLLSLYHRLWGNMRKPCDADWCQCCPPISILIWPNVKMWTISAFLPNQMWSGAVQLGGRLEGFVRGSLRCGYMATESVGCCRLSKWDTWLDATSIPAICHFLYTDRVFEFQILHPQMINTLKILFQNTPKTTLKILLKIH